MKYTPMIYFPEDVKKYGVETALIIGVLHQVSALKTDPHKGELEFNYSLDEICMATGMSLKEVQENLPAEWAGWYHESVKTDGHGHYNMKWGRVTTGGEK